MKLFSLSFNSLILVCVLGCYSTVSSAGQGLVIALEASLFRQESDRSPVVESIRKGKIIYIHQKHFLPKDNNRKEDNPLDLQGLSDLQELQDLNDLKSGEGEFSETTEAAEKNEHEKIQGPETNNSNEFYTTVDSSGQTAYIPQQFVKLILKDERESEQKISFADHDPTDYRPKEPLSETYPFAKKKTYQGTMWLGLGTQPGELYHYSRPITEQSLLPKGMLLLSLTSQLFFDQGSMASFGAALHSTYDRLHYQFSDGESAQEEHLKIGIGPYFSHETLRVQRSSLHFFLSLLGNFYDQIIINSPNAKTYFSTYSIDTLFGCYFAQEKILDNFNLSMGLSYLLSPPSTLETSHPLPEENSASFIAREFQSDILFFVGIQSPF